MQIVERKRWMRLGDSVPDTGPIPPNMIAGTLTCPACLYPFRVHALIEKDKLADEKTGKAQYHITTIHGVVCPQDIIAKTADGKYLIEKPARAQIEDPSMCVEEV